MDVKVPSLQELAFEGCFKEILASLNICYDYSIQDVANSSCNSPPRTAELITTIRDRLDEYLGGISKLIRYFILHILYIVDNI